MLCGDQSTLWSSDCNNCLCGFYLKLCRFLQPEEVGAVVDIGECFHYFMRIYANEANNADV